MPRNNINCIHPIISIPRLRGLASPARAPHTSPGRQAWVRNGPLISGLKGRHNKNINIYIRRSRQNILLLNCSYLNANILCRNHYLKFTSISFSISKQRVRPYILTTCMVYMLISLASLLISEKGSSVLVAQIIMSISYVLCPSNWHCVVMSKK